MGFHVSLGECRLLGLGLRPESLGITENQTQKKVRTWFIVMHEVEG